MARTIRFGNKNIKKPGPYSRIVSGIKNGFVNLPFGGLLVIDTGSGANWGGGSGIAGTLKKNGDAVYHFESLPDFQSFIRGGLWYKLGEPLFFPNQLNSPGISYIDFIRACATVPAEISLSFTGGGSNGGSIVLQCRNEGKGGNGVLGNETRATSTITITAAGTGGDTVNILANAVNIGSYPVVAGNTTAIIATALIAAINTGTETHGYEAVALNATSFKITAPVNLGTTANGYTLAVSVTGSNGAAGTSGGAFAGGVTGTKLTRGFGAKMVAGVIDSTKFKLSFLQGTFKGLDTAISNGDPFDGILEKDTDPIEISDSPEFSFIQDLQDWLTNNAEFNQYFKLKTFTINGTGAVTSADLTANSSTKVATGGTETYNSTHLNTALDYAKNSQTSFILCDKWGVDAQHARNVSILGWNATEARFPKSIYIAGGKTEDNFATSAPASTVDSAVLLNNQDASIVHGGISLPKVGGGFKEYDSIFHAAQMLGREAGLEPQVPLTQKQLAISGVLHKLSDKQQDLCIDRGILATFLDEDYDPARFVVLKGCNTLQANTNLVNENSTTASKQIRRIENQLNKEIVINAKRKFFGQENGVNRNTASVADVIAFTQDFLGTKVATPTVDNLILDFGNINVEVQGDAYYITYEFEPNFEVNFMLFTGVLIDPNS